MKNLSEILGDWFNNKPVEDDTLFSSEVSEDEVEQAYIDYIDALDSPKILAVGNSCLRNVNCKAYM